MGKRLCVVIIPYHKEGIDDRLVECIQSYHEALKNYSGDGFEFKLVLSTPDSFDIDGVDIFVNGEDDDEDRGSSYPILVNEAIEAFKDEADYFTILEFDDKLTRSAFNVFDRYEFSLSSDEPDVDTKVFCGLAFVLKGEEGSEPTLVGISNEAAFAPNLAEEYGKLDFNMMLKNNFMFLNGSFIHKSVFAECGLLKTNFEMFCDYEFALRMVYNGISIQSIPKVTHLHFLSEDGAFAKQKDSPRHIVDQWLSAARKEYFFNEEREILINREEK